VRRPGSRSAPQRLQARLALHQRLRDGDLSKLGTVRNDFAAHRQSLTSPHLIPLAGQGLERVLRKSELQELWAEGQDKSWLNEMTKLLARLR